jgi:Flp pilus assembly CpaF family ATPase
LAETSFARGRWAVRHVPPTPRSIVELLRAGTLDAELAATLWVLIEGRVPIIVAADGRGARLGSTAPSRTGGRDARP